MSLLQIAILGILQGFAELLPVSSSAHVILAQHLMGLNPSAPEMTFLLVMLHTGTMFAVLVYFWKRWKSRVGDKQTFWDFFKKLIIATAATGILGLSLKIFIEKVVLEKIFNIEKAEIETLFSILPLIAASLAVAGILIIYTGRRQLLKNNNKLTVKSSIWIGLVQGLCLPFRGLSRSGATISAALLQGAPFDLAEDFSFALAVLLTPPVIVLELRRLQKSQINSEQLMTLVAPGLFGMVISFIAGLIALRLLSHWLQGGHWKRFGYYCIFLAFVTLGIHFFNF